MGIFKKIIDTMGEDLKTFRDVKNTLLAVMLISILVITFIHVTSVVTPFGYIVTPVAYSIILLALFILLLCVAFFYAEMKIMSIQNGEKTPQTETI